MESSNQTEAELERFREQWRAEVKAKVGSNRPSTVSEESTPAKGPARGHTHQRSVSKLTTTKIPQDDNDHDDDEPRAYHDVETKEPGRRLDDNTTGAPSLSCEIEPKTALEFYEKAVEKEGQGILGESLSNYRKAFKIDPRVQDKYKSKHFPAVKPPAAHSSDSSTKTQKLDQSQVPEPLASVSDLLAAFSHLSILGEAPPTEFSPAPPCPIARIPDEVLVDILQVIAVSDTASLPRLSRTCKRLAYLVSAEDSVWKPLVHDTEFGFPAMLYDYTCTLEWNELFSETVHDLELDSSPVMQSQPQLILPLSPSFPSYRQMFRARPRIRFNGCYISTVNYTRPGAIGSNSLMWNHSILIVTYYRYLRFFPDGSVISLLTTTAPPDVVPYLQKVNMHYQHEKNSSLPQAVIKDALKGHWRLSGDPFGRKASRNTRLGLESEFETEGDIHIETEGVVPKYKYIMQLRLGSVGKGAKNNKAKWVGYWNYNKLTDDMAEFERKNYRSFFWHRVKSWL